MASLDHLRKHCTTHIERAIEIDRDHAIEFRRVNVVTVCKATDTGNVAQHVDLAERLRNFGDNRFHLIPLTYIARERKRSIANGIGCFLCIVEIHIKTRDLATFGTESLGNAATDSRASTSHDDAFSYITLFHEFLRDVCDTREASHSTQMNMKR
jgi:hypothetical protein